MVKHGPWCVARGVVLLKKRKNRRIELKVTGVPADTSSRNQWLILGGQRPERPIVKPSVRKIEPTTTPGYARKLPEANNSVPLPRPKPNQQTVKGDYFPELSEQAGQTTAMPAGPASSLPRTFTGYTIEVFCSSRPLAAGASLFQSFKPVFLREEPAGTFLLLCGRLFYPAGSAGVFPTKDAVRLSKCQNCLL